MDIVVIVIVLLALAILIFKRFSSFIYYIGIADIFLRVINFIFGSIKIPTVSRFVLSYFPNSLFNIVDIYCSGIFQTVLEWTLVIIYVILLGYLIRTFFRKK